jgi:nitrate reductase NapD
MHISSIVVHADPTAAARVRAAIDSVAGLEVHAATDDGKLVVTIEAPGEGESIALMDQVHALPDVLAVAMVFHQCETDPEEEI